MFWGQYVVCWTRSRARRRKDRRLLIISWTMTMKQQISSVFFYAVQVLTRNVPLPLPMCEACLTPHWSSLHCIPCSHKARSYRTNCRCRARAARGLGRPRLTSFKFKVDMSIKYSNWIQNIRIYTYGQYHMNDKSFKIYSIHISF